jgi:predicted acetyltransferase
MTDERGLRLRPLRPRDEATFREAHRAMAASDALSLVIARSVGIDRVLVTCGDDNPGSIAVIEACGGQLDSLVEDGPDAPPIRRYWID